MEYKKIIVNIIILLVLCGASFWSGGISPGKRADQYNNRITELQVQLDESINLVGNLRAENERLNNTIGRIESENQQLRNDIDDLQKINIRLDDLIRGISVSNSDTRQGIEEAKTGIGSAIERLRKIIEENKTPKSDNNS